MGRKYCPHKPSVQMWSAAVGMAASTSLRQDLAVPAGDAVGASGCTEGIYESVCQWGNGQRNACVCANVLWCVSVCVYMILCKCVMVYEHTVSSV